MLPWYQQSQINLNDIARPNYVIVNNLFETEISTTTYFPYYQATTQEPLRYPTPYVRIEAQVLHYRNKRPLDDTEPGGEEERGNEHGAGFDQSKPRVSPADRFEPKQDAIILNKAMIGSGTNEAQIIKVITKRSLEQRLVIAEIYKEMFGSDLANDLKRETSGNFRRLLLALMTPLYQFYARELHDAMDRPGTNEDVLIEILCTLSNNEMEQVKRAYQNMYRIHLEEHIRDETSGHFKELLISLADRTDDYESNSLKAKEQARRLHRAGELRWGTDESEFISILSTQSYAQLNEIFYQYQAMTQHDIEDVVIAEFSGDLKTALRAIVRVVRNKPLYFAECLYNSMKGPGTNNRKLIRIMVTRSELDLGDIAEAFRMKYGAKLETFVKSDTSGDYQRALLGLLGSPQRPTYRDFHDLILFEPGEKGSGTMSISAKPKQSDDIQAKHSVYTNTTKTSKKHSKFKENKSKNLKSDDIKDTSSQSSTESGDENEKETSVTKNYNPTKSGSKNKHKNANSIQTYPYGSKEKPYYSIKSAPKTKGNKKKKERDTKHTSTRSVKVTTATSTTEDVYQTAREPKFDSTVLKDTEYVDF